MENRIAFTVPVSLKSLSQVLSNLELLFRLNIQWHLKAHNFKIPLSMTDSYHCTLYLERVDRLIDYEVKIDYSSDFSHLMITLEGDLPRKFQFRLLERDGGSYIELEEIRNNLTKEEIMELNLWLKSIINYAMILESSKTVTKAWKFFLDKVYLKLSPTGRRIVFLVVISEIFALLFFILLLLYFLIF
ncbi:MAG: hypothetical protein N2327_06175 [Caldimicrobium sp.]|nr:hypothetical protein [Caldimicrobium sp.]MCX7873998.1 hypothetical protein [Caldimicrobium sp.]MDW8094146.1 hypothetical protein [Caldimicrobium sp.]